jgi:hypothetical protein
VSKLPLSFRFADGGRDQVAEAKYGIPAAKHAELLAISRIDDLSPYLYPRNACGRGYLVELSREGVESLELPQLEEPEDRLTPRRLAAEQPQRWTEMPFPQSLGWLGYGWFPRISLMGVVPAHVSPTHRLFEVRKGWVAADILEEKPAERAFDMRACNAASWGLQLPFLAGGEEVTLFNLSPLSSQLRFALPRERPEIWTDGRKGKFNETKPVMHALIIEPDRALLSIVWRGAAPALRPYTDEELAQMPLKVKWA